MAVLLLVAVTALPGADGAPRWLPDGGTMFGIGAALALTALVIGRTAAFPLPGGAIGASSVLIVDRLSALFLSLLFVSALVLPILVRTPDTGATRLAVVLVGLVILCGDGVLLAAAAPAAALALNRLGGDRPRTAAPAMLAGTVVLLLGSAAGIGGAAGGDGFAVLRDRVVPSGTATVAAVVLLAASCGILLRSAVPRGAGMPAGRCGAAVLALLLGQYLLLRLGFDLGAPLLGVPAAGVALLAAGAAAFAVPCLRALWAGDLRAGVFALVVAPGGLSLAALGTAAEARGMDLPGPEAAAAGAAVLLAIVQVLASCTLLPLCETAASELGGTDLRRLGGAATSMPRATAAAALGACMLAGMPPFGGYTAGWMLIHAVLAVARFSGRWPVVAAAGTAVGVGVCGAAAAVLAWSRLFVLVAIERPRTPRAAAALDIGPGTMRGHLAVLALAAVPALLPWLLGRASPIPGIPAADGVGVAAIAASGGGAGYAASVVLVLLLGAWLLVRSGTRRFGGPSRLVASWNDGMRADPPWLPFGDPVLRPGPATLPSMVEGELGVLPRYVRLAGDIAAAMHAGGRRGRRALRRLVVPAFEPAGTTAAAAAAAAVILLGWWLGS